MVPVATGGDGGGSIRIPASCCGLFGFKPSRGLVPTGPELGELWRGFSTEHALTRSVRDSAAMLDAVAGDEPGAPYAAPAGAGSFLAAARAARPGELRVAFTTRALVGPADTRIDPVCVDAAHDAVRLLRSIGHSVDEAAPQLDGESLANAFVTILAGEAAAETHRMAALIGRRVGPADVEPATWTLVLVGRALSAETYARAAHEVQRAGRVLGEFFGRYDVLLTPTLARPPLRVGELALAPAERLGAQVLGRLRAGRLLRALGVVEQVAARSFAYIPFTPLFNATGLPAMSLPLANADHGLPVGVQVGGRFGDDARLFALAAQLESVRSWSQRMPPGLSA
jgi:amidase